MKKVLSLFLVLLLTLSFTSCSTSSNHVPKEQPVSYAEKIDVVITQIYKRQFWAGTVQREVEVTVYSEEYNLTNKFTERYAGIFGNMPLWECEKGNTVKARMITFVMKSTGKVVNRYIDLLY